FMYEWLKETMIQKQINKNDLELFLNKALKEAFESLVNEYRRGLRAGVAKRWGDIILYLEREESTNGI
ncbi:MAG: hypothetical protein ACP5PO_08900, partial [Desulfurella sp.]|uniref:hypothetical protein n=1 Tax=Desulfurella sp. TaxID=1962857 RepID=UPI003D13A5A4